MSEQPMALTPDDPAYAGQKEYTPSFLRVYDQLILKTYCRFVWRCPTSRLADLYESNLRQRHLDVGPGTGFFLQRTTMPEGASVTLLDPNANVLAFAGRRLTDLRPQLVQADVCKPLTLQARFGSVAMNLVWHCLPSSGKAAAFHNVAAVLDDDGVLFGATVLGDPKVHNALSRLLLRYVNRRGTFDNLHDDEKTLRAALEAAFGHVDIEVVGTTAVFTARVPRPRG